jgi:hypothetical protein
VPCVDVYGPRPIATGRLDQDPRSQLLTYIRLLYAAGQRLRREPRWIFARFHLIGSETLAEAMPVHTPGSGSNGMTVSSSPAILLQLPGETSFCYSFVCRFTSSCFHRRCVLVECAAREHGPYDPRILVSERDSRDIGIRSPTGWTLIVAVGMSQRATNGSGQPYSITSSALASRDGGTVRPSALAVFRLMVKSNFVGCTTGSSAGVSPFRIRPT